MARISPRTGGVFAIVFIKMLKIRYFLKFGKVCPAATARR